MTVTQTSVSLLSDGQCAWDADVGVAFVRRSRGTGGTNPFIDAANFSVPSLEETSEPFHCWFGVCSASGNGVIDPFRISALSSQFLQLTQVSHLHGLTTFGSKKLQSVGEVV